MRLAIQNYARRVQLDTQAHDVGPEIGTVASQDRVKMIAEQATPKTSKNGRTALLIIGYCPPDRALNAMPPYWKCGPKTPRILLNLINHRSQWEEDSGKIQQTSWVRQMRPALSLHSMF